MCMGILDIQERLGTVLFSVCDIFHEKLIFRGSGTERYNHCNQNDSFPFIYHILSKGDYQSFLILFIEVMNIEINGDQM